eukprot:jgi/Bigna1/81431/fgenesh1_pg.80_\
MDNDRLLRAMNAQYRWMKDVYERVSEVCDEEAVRAKEHRSLIHQDDGMSGEGDSTTVQELIDCLADLDPLTSPSSSNLSSSSVLPVRDRKIRRRTENHISGEGGRLMPAGAENRAMSKKQTAPSIALANWKRQKESENSQHGSVGFVKPRRSVAELTRMVLALEDSLNREQRSNETPTDEKVDAKGESSTKERQQPPLPKHSEATGESPMSSESLGIKYTVEKLRNLHLHARVPSTLNIEILLKAGDMVEKIRSTWRDSNLIGPESDGGKKDRPRFVTALSEANIHQTRSLVFRSDRFVKKIGESDADIKVTVSDNLKRVYMEGTATINTSFFRHNPEWKIIGLLEMTFCMLLGKTQSTMINSIGECSAVDGWYHLRAGSSNQVMRKIVGQIKIRAELTVPEGCDHPPTLKKNPFQSPPLQEMAENLRRTTSNYSEPMPMTMAMKLLSVVCEEDSKEATPLVNAAPQIDGDAEQHDGKIEDRSSSRVIDEWDEGSLDTLNRLIDTEIWQEGENWRRRRYRIPLSLGKEGDLRPSPSSGKNEGWRPHQCLSVEASDRFEENVNAHVVFAQMATLSEQLRSRASDRSRASQCTE